MILKLRMFSPLELFLLVVLWLSITIAYSVHSSSNELNVTMSLTTLPYFRENSQEATSAMTPRRQLVGSFYEMSAWFLTALVFVRHSTQQ